MDHRTFVDAVREVLGLEPLYCQTKSRLNLEHGLGEDDLRVFDEPERAPDDAEQKPIHGATARFGWFNEQRRRGNGMTPGRKLPRYNLDKEEL